MNRIRFIVLPTILTFMIFACRKEDDIGCLGCGIDTSIKEYTFQVDGRIHADCSGLPASGREIELTLFYKKDTIVTVGQTDAAGNFFLSYKLLLPGYYWQSAKWESYCILNIQEDSVVYFLSGLDNHSNLDLQVGDSLDINFYVDFIHNPLKESDTIYYRFTPSIMAGSSYTYKVGGPLDDHALINTVKDKWKFVQLDEVDRPVVNYYIKIVRGNGNQSPYGFIPTGTKEPCIMSHQDLVILLN